MVTYTQAPEFAAVNAESPIVSGREFGTKGTGIVVTLANGQVHTITVGELNKLPEGLPRWADDVELEE